MADQYIHNLTDTWNAGGTTFAAIKMNVTDSASASDSKLLDLQIGSVTKFKVDKAGDVTGAAGTLTAGLTVTQSTANAVGATITGNGTGGGAIIGAAAGPFGSRYIGMFRDSGNTAYQIHVGFDTTGGAHGWLQATAAGSGNVPLKLNPSGGTVETGGQIAPTLGLKSRNGNGGTPNSYGVHLYYTGSALEVWVDSTKLGTVNITP